MKKLFILVCICLSLFNSCDNKVPQFSHKAMLKNIFHKKIVPGFTNFKDECDALARDLDSYRENFSAENLEKCRRQWTRVMLSWRHCDLFNVGEYRKTFIKARIYTIFAKSTFNSQKDKFNKAVKLESLGSTVKGISALEYLLFNEKVDRSLYLDYMSLIAKELKDLAAQSLEVWQKSESSFTSKSDLLFGSSIQELVNEQVRYCEEFYFKKFSYPLGYLYSVDFSIVEHFESKAAIAGLKESVSVIEEIFKDHFFELIKFQNKESSLPEKMLSQIAAVKSRLSKIDTLPFYEDEIPAELEKLFSELRELFMSVKVGVVNQLGVTIVLPNDGD